MILQEGLYCILYSTLGSLLFHLWTLSDSESTGFSIGLFNFFKSSISGLIIFTMIKSNLILGAFKENLIALLVLCFVSGFNDDIH